MPNSFIFGLFIFQLIFWIILRAVKYYFLYFLKQKVVDIKIQRQKFIISNNKNIKLLMLSAIIEVILVIIISAIYLNLMMNSRTMILLNVVFLFFLILIILRLFQTRTVKNFVIVKSGQVFFDELSNKKLFNVKTQLRSDLYATRDLTIIIDLEGKNYRLLSLNKDSCLEFINNCNDFGIDVEMDHLTHEYLYL